MSKNISHEVFRLKDYLFFFVLHYVDLLGVPKYKFLI